MVLVMPLLSRILRTVRDPYSRRSTLIFVKSQLLRRGKPSDTNDVKDLKQFWDTTHRHQKHLWLTGSPPKEVITRLDVRDEINEEGSMILDVGVGLGLMARYLLDNGRKVDALDISSNAIERVKPFVNLTFVDASQLPNLRYSLIMHHLVAQHMSDKNLQDQIRHLVRSLKNGGVVALQFSAPISDRAGLSKDCNLSVQAGGGIVRTPDEMITLVSDAGGRLMSVVPREKWEKYGSQYWVIKFAR